MKLRITMTNKVGQLTPRGKCQCTHEAGDSYCDVHPRCDDCNDNLENATAYTTGGISRYCWSCYSRIEVKP